ncbi:MAG: hypothetical protein ABIG84_05205 [archaeon]
METNGINYDEHIIYDKEFLKSQLKFKDATIIEAAASNTLMLPHDPFPNAIALKTVIKQLNAKPLAYITNFNEPEIHDYHGQAEIPETALFYSLDKNTIFSLPKTGYSPENDHIVRHCTYKIAIENEIKNIISIGMFKDKINKNGDGFYYTGAYDGDEYTDKILDSFKAKPLNSRGSLKDHHAYMIQDIAQQRRGAQNEDRTPVNCMVIKAGIKYDEFPSFDNVVNSSKTIYQGICSLLDMAVNENLFSEMCEKQKMRIDDFYNKNTPDLDHMFA